MRAMLCYGNEQFQCFHWFLIRSNSVYDGVSADFGYVLYVFNGWLVFTLLHDFLSGA